VTVEPTPETLAGARLLAEFNSYEGFVEALRRRARELRISPGSEAFAEVSGLSQRYAAKLLGSGKVKRLGPISMQPILQCLGARLALLVDEESLEHIVKRLPQMDERHVRSRASTWTVSGHMLKKYGRLGGLATARVRADAAAQRAKWRLQNRAQRAKRAAARRAQEITTAQGGGEDPQ
jgi:hypothetical protein